jgi:hypothetical protein
MIKEIIYPNLTYTQYVNKEDGQPVEVTCVISELSLHFGIIPFMKGTHKYQF